MSARRAVRSKTTLGKSRGTTLVLVSAQLSVVATVVSPPRGGGMAVVVGDSIGVVISTHNDATSLCDFSQHRRTHLQMKEDAEALVAARGLLAVAQGHEPRSAQCIVDIDMSLLPPASCTRS